MRVWALQLLLPVLGRAFLLPLAHPVDTASTVATRRSGAVSMSAQECSTRDLLIVGAGTLGQYVGKIYKEMHGDEAQVFGETASESRHQAVKELGVTPFTRQSRGEFVKDGSVSNIVFCVPPSKNENYAGEIREALRLWSGQGNFVFTSSGGVYDEDSGGRVNEASPITASPRVQKILEAERAVMEARGVVLRLAGLYTRDRGPHTFWLSRGEVAAAEGGYINLLHYEDAARATIAAVMNTARESEQRVLLVSDDVPLTRKQICEAAVSSPAFRGKYKVPVFKVEEGVPQSLGKIYEDAQSREALGGWKPRYSSFADFMSKQDSREDALV